MVSVIATDHTLQPCAYCVDRLTHPLRYSPAPYDEMAFVVRRTVVREPKKRERLRCSLATLLPIDLREPTKFDQSRLLRMEFQREVRQPFPKLSQEPLSVFTPLKADHQIVSVSDKHHLSARYLPAPCLNPQVEHIVQIHVRQKRRNHRSLRRACHRL